MKDEVYSEIVAHCRKELPNEACGLVILVEQEERYIPCSNISTSPTEEFCISPAEYADAEDLGEIVAIVHSHPSGVPSPSITDRASCNKWNISWLIVGITEAEHSFCWLLPKENSLSLYGKKYVWGVDDCGSFIRDFYKQEFNIDIPDFHRPPKFWEQGIELYLDCYKKAGFYDIAFNDLQYGDVILFALGSEITTHGAVYVGDNTIAHHLSNRLSSKDVLGKYYLDRATKYLRHKDMK